MAKEGETESLRQGLGYIFQTGKKSEILSGREKGFKADFNLSRMKEKMRGGGKNKNHTGKRKVRHPETAAQKKTAKSSHPK